MLVICRRPGHGLKCASGLLVQISTSVLALHPSCETSDSLLIWCGHEAGNLQEEQVMDKGVRTFGSALYIRPPVTCLTHIWHMRNFSITIVSPYISYIYCILYIIYIVYIYIRPPVTCLTHIRLVKFLNHCCLALYIYYIHCILCIIHI